jgi:hypothetical protein
MKQTSLLPLPPSSPSAWHMAGAPGMGKTCQTDEVIKRFGWLDLSDSSGLWKIQDSLIHS